MSSLVRLELINNELSQIPSNLFSNHTNLERLYLDKNSITSITADAFAALPKLDQVHLQDNSISALALGLFDALPLTDVDLHNNSLSSIPKDLFANHPSPQDIANFNIAENPFTTVGDAAYNANGWQITDAVWINAGSDYQFRLSIGHALPADLVVSYTVTDGTVSNATEGTLTIVSGSTTSDVITVIPTIATATYSLTSHLTSFNPFSGHIDSALLTAGIDTTSIYCSIDLNLLQELLTLLGNVHCSEISEAALSGLAGALNISEKAISAIDPSVTQALSGATTLRLDTNSLTSLPAESFANLANLTELNLNNNDISTIGENAFANMSSLVRLELINNELSQIPSNLFSNHTNLERLYLQ